MEVEGRGVVYGQWLGTDQAAAGCLELVPGHGRLVSIELAAMESIDRWYGRCPVGSD